MVKSLREVEKPKIGPGGISIFLREIYFDKYIDKPLDNNDNYRWSDEISSMLSAWR